MLEQKRDQPGGRAVEQPVDHLFRWMDRLGGDRMDRGAIDHPAAVERRRIVVLALARPEAGGLSRHRDLPGR